MKLSELIEKLNTFPPGHICKFYCPTDGTFYYIRSISITLSGTIYLLSTCTRPIYGNTYAHWVGSFSQQHYIPYKNREIKFMIGGTEFRAL